MPHHTRSNPMRASLGRLVNAFAAVNQAGVKEDQFLQALAERKRVNDALVASRGATTAKTRQETEHEAAAHQALVGAQNMFSGGPRNLSDAMRAFGGAAALDSDVDPQKLGSAFLLANSTGLPTQADFNEVQAATGSPIPVAAPDPLALQAERLAAAFGGFNENTVFSTAHGDARQTQAEDAAQNKALAVQAADPVNMALTNIMQTGNGVVPSTSDLVVANRADPDTIRTFSALDVRNADNPDDLRKGVAMQGGGVPSNSQLSNVVNNGAVERQLNTVGPQTPALSKSDAQGAAMQGVDGIEQAVETGISTLPKAIQPVFRKHMEALHSRAMKVAKAKPIFASLRAEMDKGGNSVVGRAGAFFRITDNLRATAVGILDGVGISLGDVQDDSAFAETVVSAAAGTKWENLARTNAKFRSGMISLAFMQAKDMDENGRLSDNDVRLALEAIGADLSNANSLDDVLNAVESRMTNGFSTDLQTTQNVWQAMVAENTEGAQSALNIINRSFGAGESQPQTGQAGSVKDMSDDELKRQLGITN